MGFSGAKPSANHETPKLLLAARAFLGACATLAAMSGLLIFVLAYGHKWLPAGFHNSVAPFYSSWSFAALGLASGIVALVLALISSRWLLAGSCLVGALASGLLALVHLGIWGLGQTGWH